MATDIPNLDFLDKIVNVHFGGAWLLINADTIGGVNGSKTNPNPPVPPFGSFSYSLAKGSSLLQGKIVKETTTTTPSGQGTDDIFFPWPANGTTGPIPNLSNYSAQIPIFSNGQIVGFIPGITYANQFCGLLSEGAPAADHETYYSTLDLAKTAAAALGRAANLIETAIPSAAPPPFVISPTPYTSFSTQRIQQPIIKPGSSGAEFNKLFLFAIPSNKTTTGFTITINDNSTQGIGWASIFTKSTKPIKSISDLQGNADQTCYFQQQLKTHAFTIVTDGSKVGKGKITVDGTGGGAGVSPSAPPQKPT